MFDVMLVFQIHAYGFPPDHTLRFSENGEMILTPSTEERVQFGLALLAIGIVQAVVFRVTWKVWRR